MSKRSYTLHESVYKVFLQPLPLKKIPRPTYPYPILFKTQSVDEHYSSSGVKGLSFQDYQFLFTTRMNFSLNPRRKDLQHLIEQTSRCLQF
uniref:Uncharacterized protein n=1 Tax=Fagonia indica TaxID=66629 RepID=A0A6C0U9T2_9ROSI|nr:hypothetical protein [Fagonia indica]